MSLHGGVASLFSYSDYILLLFPVRRIFLHQSHCPVKTVIPFCEMGGEKYDQDGTVS